MTNWITADTHFNHVNICGPTLSSWDSGYRDFKSLIQMNNTIIENINAVVAPDDTLYHLGDFAFGNKTEIPALRERINCKNIILLKGNHDDKLWDNYRSYFQKTLIYLELYVSKIPVCLFHYPIASWHKIGRGAVNLYGHCHGNFSSVGRQKDVGMDCNSFKPLHLENTVAKLSQKKVVTVDHHTKETNYH